MEKSIDIIIPAYKSQETIIKTLSSIAEQSISDQCIVTIVNDADGIGYGDIVSTFSKILDIRELTLPINGGPGVARQVGIDNTFLPYIMFADSDDTFYNSFAFEMMLDCINRYPKTAMVRAKHYLQTSNPLQFTLYHYNFTWVFAKIYRREFLNKYNIRFPNSRSNEDVGFNQQIHFLAYSVEETPVDLNEIIYIWHDNPNSITRAETDFLLKDNIVGYIDNMIYAIKRSTHRPGVKNTHILLKSSIKTMADLYLYYEEILSQRPEYAEVNFKACVKYYNEIYEVIELTQDSSFIDNLIIEEMAANKDKLTKFLPPHTFKEFMKNIREAAQNED